MIKVGTHASHFLFVLLLLIPGLSSAQSRYVMSSDPEFKVSGTSTLHDWDMVSSTGTGTMVMDVEGGRIVSIGQATITMPATGLKSGRSAMDKNTYKALDAKHHPNITFVLTEVRGLKSTGLITKMVAVGDLTAAGTTRRVEMAVSGRIEGDRVHLQGNTGILLTDLKIEPPTAVLGTIKTGNAVTLAFKATFEVENATK